jgi:hypothetical protein
MYQAAGAPGAEQQAHPGGNGHGEAQSGEAGSAKKDDDVVDADYKEV